MKVFLLEPSYRNNDYAYESLWPAREADSPAFWRFDCVPKGESWDEQEAVVVSSDGDEPAGDFPQLRTGCLVLSEKARLTLDTMLKNCGELLPLPCTDGRRFTMCNPYPCYDFLDHENSKGKRFSESGRWMRVERYSFHRNAVPNRAVFKLTGFETKIIFASSEFKKSVEEAGLVGLRFREVWNDDGDPTETVGLLDFIN